MSVRPAIAVLAALAATALPCSAQAAPLPDPWPALGIDCASQGLAGTPYVPGVNCRHLVQDGYPRRYVVWVPQSATRRMDRGGRVPLVLMLHGSSGTGEQFLRISGWREKAAAEGFVVAFPTGLEYLVTDRPHPRHSTKWSSYNLPGIIDLDQRPPGYPPAPAPFPADDVGFLRSLAQDVHAGLRIDGRRQFVAGFSNGAEMCARLAVEASDVVAAAACSSGGLDAVHPTIAGHPNAPVLLTLGSRDDRVLAQIAATDPDVTEIPLDPAAIVDLPVLSAFVRNNLASFGLSDASPTLTLAPRSTELRWQVPLAGNTDGNALLFGVLAGVTHQYPNGRNNPGGFVMADRAWEFFQRHPRPPAAAAEAPLPVRAGSLPARPVWAGG